MTLTETLQPNNDAAVNDTGENNVVAPMKRLRLEQKDGRKPPCTPIEYKLHTNNRFLQVHLQMLKSLYTDDSSTSLNEDKKVEDSEWKCIEQYLRDQDSIQTMGLAVQRMRNIQDEAMKFEATVASQYPPHSMAVTAPITTPVVGRITGSGRFTPANHMYRSSLMNGAHTTTPKSPYNRGRHNPIYDYPYSTTRASTSSSPMRFHHQSSVRGKGTTQGISSIVNKGFSGDDGNNDQRKSFAIISTLLKRKYQCASNHFREKSAPYQSLLLSVHARIHDLQARLKDYAEMTELAELSSFDDGTATDFGGRKPGAELIATNGRADESRVRMETKVKLWTVLYHDLRSATR